MFSDVAGGRIADRRAGVSPELLQGVSAQVFQSAASRCHTSAPISFSRRWKAASWTRASSSLRTRLPQTLEAAHRFDDEFVLIVPPRSVIKFSQPLPAKRLGEVFNSQRWL